MSELLGTTATVYRFSLGDCTNGGLSGRYPRILVVGPLDFPYRHTVPARMDLGGGKLQAPTFVLGWDGLGRDRVLVPFHAGTRDQIIAMGTHRALERTREAWGPVSRWAAAQEAPDYGPAEKGGWWMFGGNYAELTAGMFKIHDRFETAEQTSALSR